MTLAEYLARREYALDVRAYWIRSGGPWGFVAHPGHVAWCQGACACVRGALAMARSYVPYRGDWPPPRDRSPLPLP